MLLSCYERRQKVLQILGLINSLSKSGQQKVKMTSQPLLLYGCEIWSIRQDGIRITSAEIKFTSRTAKYTWQDFKASNEIFSELKAHPVLGKIQNYLKKWRMEHTLRMGRHGLLNLLVKYHPNGNSRRDLPLKRLTSLLHETTALERSWSPSGKAFLVWLNLVTVVSY